MTVLAPAGTVVLSCSVPHDVSHCTNCTADGVSLRTRTLVKWLEAVGSTDEQPEVPPAIATAASTDADAALILRVRSPFKVDLSSFVHSGEINRWSLQRSGGKSVKRIDVSDFTLVADRLIAEY
jgi:hypothetical protein